MNHSVQSIYKIGLCILSAIVVSASHRAIASDYRRKMECADGGVIVDVDLDEPRVGQVVIRDYRAIDYFKSRGIVRDMHFLESAPYELLLKGQQQTRITDGFHGFEGNAGFGRLRINRGFGPYNRHSYLFFAYREGNGIKIRVDEKINSFSGCTVYIPNPQGYASDCQFAGGKNVSFESEYHADRANWFFPNCREL